MKNCSGLLLKFIRGTESANTGEISKNENKMKQPKSPEFSVILKIKVLTRPTPVKDMGTVHASTVMVGP